MKDCRKCKDYRDCAGKPWFHYGQIRFCPYQVLWIIEHSDTLLAGDWPPDPDSSSYVDPDIKGSLKDEAYYAKPVGILAEVNARLARTGTHGKLLRAEVLADLDLSQEAKDALMYVKGWRRKRMSFQKWLRDRRYSQKKYGKNIVLMPPS